MGVEEPGSCLLSVVAGCVGFPGAPGVDVVSAGGVVVESERFGEDGCGCLRDELA
jgi:hypothetical protein